MTTTDEMHDHHDAARRSDRWALPLAALSGTLLDELSYAEVAERLGATVTDVRNHVHRGKQKLSGYLRAEVRLYAADPKEHEDEVALLNGLLGGS